MSEKAEQLLGEIGRDFETRMKTDPKLLKLAGKIPKNGTYETAGEYAVRTGELLHASVMDHASGFIGEPAGTIGEVMRPLLQYEHQLTADAAMQAQRNLNTEAGLGLEPLPPDIDPGRIDRVIDQAAGIEDAHGALDALKEQIINYGQSAVDATLKKNAKADAEAGVKRYIVRKTEKFGRKARKLTKGRKKPTYYTVPCKWCRAQAGRYLYTGAGANVPDSVFQRHTGCRCTLTYENGKERQNVWDRSQKWSADDADGQAKAMERERTRRENEQRAKQESAAKRAEDVRAIMEREGWDAKTASIWRNKNIDAINQAGGAEKYLNASDAQRKIWRQTGEMQFILNHTKWTEQQAYTWWLNNRGNINQHGLRATLNAFLS